MASDLIINENDRKTLARILRAHPSPSRRSVRDFFDAWVEERISDDDNRPISFMHAVVRAASMDKELNPADDRDALILALSALGDIQQVVEWLTAAVSQRLFDVSGADNKREAQRVKLIRKVNSAWKRHVDVPHIRFQRGSFELSRSAYQVFSDPGHIAPAALLARRRLCRIVSKNGNDAVRGSGFLVGPSTVLTNHHVIEHLLAEDGAGGKVANETDDPGLVTCHFDYSPTTGRMNDQNSKIGVNKNWCLGFSFKGTGKPETTEGNWWTKSEIRVPWVQSLSDSLDYALINLASSPGLQRGWYDLTDLGKIEESRGCWVLHHPNGDEQKMTEGNLRTFSLSDNRIFHTASTLDGSSGGLLLNEHGKPIALHHAGLGIDVFKPDESVNIREWDDFANMAVPLKVIAEDLRDKQLLNTVSEPTEIAPYTGQIERGQPVFGRANFYHDLKMLFLGNGPKIMMIDSNQLIEPNCRPGKSFSARIIRHVFSGSGHAHIELGQDQRKFEARPLAAELMKQLNPDLVEGLEETLNTTGPAFAEALARQIVDALRDSRNSNRIIWIYLDDLEHAHVADGSGREFLASLYSSASQVENLRIVLIGLPARAQIGGIGINEAIISEIGFSDIDDLDKHVRDWIMICGGRDKAESEWALELLANSIASYADTDHPLEQAAKFAREHVARPLARLVRK